MELKNWACLRIMQTGNDKSIKEDPCKNKLNEFQDHLRLKGIFAEKTNAHGDLRISNDNYEPLKQWFKESVEGYNVRFLLIVLPEHPTSELYSRIKKFGGGTYGVHTVCVKADKPFKFGNKQYDDNVALVSTNKTPSQ